MSATRKASGPGKEVSSGHDERRPVTTRPDRVGKVAMTTRVSPGIRKIFKRLAAELDDTTMEELQAVALRAFLANFRVWADLQSKWEALRQEFGEAETGD